MNNLIWIVLGLIVIGGGYAYAQSKIEKTDNGMVFTKPIEVKTYYMNRIIWGDNYVDHDDKTPVHNTEVVAFGDGWEFSTTTDDDGVFKVEVKADSPFKIKASDGNSWSTSEEQKAVEVGTTMDDRS